MNWFKKTLGVVVFMSTFGLHAQLKFELEDQLRAMSNDPHLYAKEQLICLYKAGTHWVGKTMYEHSMQKKHIAHDDQLYIGNISIMLAVLYKNI